jgi:hypothetical protein
MCILLNVPQDIGKKPSIWSKEKIGLFLMNFRSELCSQTENQDTFLPATNQERISLLVRLARAYQTNNRPIVPYLL